MDRRSLLMGALAAGGGVLPGLGWAQDAPPYGPAPLSGGKLDPNGDDSGRIVPAPAAGSADEIVRLKDDLSGLASEWIPMTAVEWDLNPDHHRKQCADKQFRHFGYEGVTMFRRGGVYYLGVVDRYFDRYSFAVWMSDKPTGALA